MYDSQLNFFLEIGENLAFDSCYLDKPTLIVKYSQTPQKKKLF